MDGGGLTSLPMPMGVREFFEAVKRIMRSKLLLGFCDTEGGGVIGRGIPQTRHVRANVEPTKSPRMVVRRLQPGD